MLTAQMLFPQAGSCYQKGVSAQWAWQRAELSTFPGCFAGRQEVGTHLGPQGAAWWAAAGKGALGLSVAFAEHCLMLPGLACSDGSSSTIQRGPEGLGMC